MRPPTQAPGQSLRAARAAAPPMHRLRGRRGPRGPRRQRGFTLLYGLMALLIMMIGAAAMVRSVNTAVLVGANLGFKRDLTNQAERAASLVLAQLETGALAAEATRQASSTTLNYSAVMLASNAQGIPNALLDDAGFAAAGTSANDISVADQAVQLRYVVDRLCANTGVADENHCSMVDAGTPHGGSASQLVVAEDNTAGGSGALQRQVVYRLSVRATGPRNTQAYFQSTFSL